MKGDITELQAYRVRLAYQLASETLREIKAKPVTGKALETMRILEGAVDHLETFMVTAKVKGKGNE
jgi:hypothetical protein